MTFRPYSERMIPADWHRDPYGTPGLLDSHNKRGDLDLILSSLKVS